MLQEQDPAIAAAVEKGASLSKRRKAPKPLRCQTILNAAHQAKPVNASASKKSKLKGPAVKAVSTRIKRPPTEKGKQKLARDLWENRLQPDPAVRPASE